MIRPLFTLIVARVSKNEIPNIWYMGSIIYFLRI